MTSRMLTLACLLAILVAAPVTAQVGHPAKGSWSGYWGPSEAAKKRILLLLDWKNNEIVGTINPGPNAVKIDKATLDVEHLDPHARGEHADRPSGGTARYVTTGKIENLGSWTKRPVLRHLRVRQRARHVHRRARLDSEASFEGTSDHEGDDHFRARCGRRGAACDRQPAPTTRSRPSSTPTRRSSSRARSRRSNGRTRTPSSISTSRVERQGRQLGARARQPERPDAPRLDAQLDEDRRHRDGGGLAREGRQPQGQRALGHACRAVKSCSPARATTPRTRKRTSATSEATWGESDDEDGGVRRGGTSLAARDSVCVRAER